MDKKRSVSMFGLIIQVAGFASIASMLLFVFYIEPRTKWRYTSHKDRKASGYESNVLKFFEGEHKLQKMNDRLTTENHIKGEAFFLLGTGVASLEGGQKVSHDVTFAWQGNDGDFIFSSIPIEKLRVRLDDAMTVPSVKFVLLSSCDGVGEECQADSMMREHGPQKVINSEYVSHVVIRIRSQDWPAQIRIP